MSGVPDVGHGRLLDLTAHTTGATLVRYHAHPSRGIRSARTSLVTQRGGPITMAKALFGHVGGPDPRMVSEMRRLQQRIRDLEAELIRLQAQNDPLAAQTRDEAISRMQEREPALT